MLLPNHKGYTEEALRNVDIGTDIKNQIIVGSTANDLCEFTNEMQSLIHSKDVMDGLVGSKEKAFGFSAIYQSHFGDLTSMHSMAKASGESPETTRSEIISWFQFLNGLALGSIVIDPDAKIGEDSVPIREIFSKHTIEYDQIFDSEDMFEIKNRAIGMMCHLIQDLFTYSHCNRNSHNEVLKFYCYQSQNKQKHKEGDHVITGLKQELLNQCRSCVENISNNIEYDYGQILSLDNDAQDSDGGIFA